MDPSDRKKREPPDPEGQPQMKKHALSSSINSVHEDVDPKVLVIILAAYIYIRNLQEAPILLYQNKAMNIRLREIKMELQTSENAVKRLHEKQRMHDETISCFSRIWEQVGYFVLSSLFLLCYKLTFSCFSVLF